MNGRLRLGVNIDHVATIRNARGGSHPDPVRAAQIAAEAGGEVIAAASIVDRSGGSADLGVPYTSLIRIDVPTYEADALPPELEAIPAIKPGSRAAA